MPRDVAWHGKTVRTGIWKAPVPGPRTVRRLNIDGDGQGDTGGHGGEMRAVLVYQLDSYRHWQRHLGRDDLGYGQFGENLTVEGMPDHEVCIGDRYRIGTAEFEVTQPRVTCFRVGIRLGEPSMPSLLVAHRRPGFYMRVITEGAIQAGDLITKTAAGPRRVSVAAADALLYLPGRDLALMREALDVPALSPGWQGSFRSLLAEAEHGKDAPAPAAVPGTGWPGFRPLSVTAVTPESATINSLTLADPDGRPLPPAHAGQYVTLRLPVPGKPPAVRSYSLSSPPGAGSYRISVKREDHGLVSRQLHASARPGLRLDIAAPRGEFTLADADTPVVLVSAGVGATPVLAMLHQLADARRPRPVWWFHAARRPADHAFRAEAAALIAELPGARSRTYYSAASGSELAGAGARAGHLDAAAFTAAGVPPEADAYICGPESFMTDMTAALTAAGLDPRRIRTELFGPRTPVNPGISGARRVPPHLPPGPPGAGPLVTFARSGLSVPYDDDSYRAVLDLAEACDVPTRWACRTGVCHTCTTPLLSGQVTYEPDPLEPPDYGSALICCARPATDLVLDI
jgi:ferredoxin-NADP reductase/MOSC domain-containing protein YiiM